MTRYQWHRDLWSRTGCEGEFLDPGWYTADGDKFIVKEYRNPKTGKPYTPTELDAIQGIVVPPYVPPVKPYVPSSSNTSIWIIVGVVLLVVVGVAIWFFMK